MHTRSETSFPEAPVFRSTTGNACRRRQWLISTSVPRVGKGLSGHTIQHACICWDFAMLCCCCCCSVCNGRVACKGYRRCTIVIAKGITMARMGKVSISMVNVINGFWRNRIPPNLNKNLFLIPVQQIIKSIWLLAANNIRC